MIIDIANPYVKKAEYSQEGKVYSRLYLYSPDIKFSKILCRCYEKDGMSKEIKQLIADDETELTYIHINYVQNKVIAFRSITSHFELFYSVFKNREKILTDHMKNMLSYLPVKTRSLSLEAVCDVAVFQHNYGKDTYIKNVCRLGYGEMLILDRNGITTKQAQQLELAKYDLQNECGEKILEDSFRMACNKMMQRGAINTLSGGVDSTLTHCIMGNPKSVSANYHHEGFKDEKQYALDAAKLLHADHTIYEIEMSEYMETLKSVCKAFGMPPFNLTTQAIHYTIAQHTKNTQIFVSELGGTFGGLFRKPYTEELGRKYSMSHPHNWANMNSSIVGESELKYLNKIFGGELIEKQLKKRNEYVLKRIKNLDTTDISADNYMQFSEFLRYWVFNNSSIEEQTEMEAGNQIVQLTGARRVMENFLSLKKKNRYYNEEYGDKPYAKKLLKQLLPAYDVNKPKLGGSLPRTWMVTEGPMAGYFKKHDIPDFVPENLRDDMIHPRWDCSWGVKHMIMFSIWKETVFDKEVERIPSKFLEKTVE